MADLSNYIGTYYPNGPMIEPGGALAFDVLATSWEAASDAPEDVTVAWNAARAKQNRRLTSMVMAAQRSK